MNITQSFIKSYKKYKDGRECGNIIKHCYVDGKLLPPTKAMRTGQYFEFCLTGALPKEGKPPIVDYMKSKPNEMMEPFRKAYNDANYVRRFFNESDPIFMGFKIVHFGVKKLKGLEGKRKHAKKYEGTLDIIAEATRDIEFKGVKIKKGELVVFDVKYSGLLNDRWNEMGWSFENDIQKDYHKIQATQYHYVSGMKFFYLVVDSSHKEMDDDKNLILPEMRIFYIPVDSEMVEMHIHEGNKLMDEFEFQKTIGFFPNPSLGACNKCPLKDECSDRALFPSIEIINVNTD